MKTCLKDLLLLPVLLVGLFGIFIARASAQTYTIPYTTLDDPLADNGTDAGAISSNYVVGNYQDANEHDHGFLYNINTGNYTTLDAPLADNGTYVQTIYGNYVAGDYPDANADGHDFIYCISPKPPALLHRAGSTALFRRRMTT